MDDNAALLVALPSRTRAVVPALPDGVRTIGAGTRGLVSQRGSDGRAEMVTSLFDQHWSSLCRLATFLLNDPNRAEEVVQEAFLRTFAGWRRVRHPERAHAYLRASVVNLCRSRQRRSMTEERKNEAVWVEQERGRETSGLGATDDAIVVLKAVGRLAARQREAVVLRYYADLSEAEVAEAMGCSIGTVKSQLAKARSALDHLLRDAEDPSGG